MAAGKCMTFFYPRILLGFFGMALIIASCFFLAGDISYDLNSYGLDAFGLIWDVPYLMVLLLANIAILCLIMYKIFTRYRTKSGSYFARAND